jgi:hypothetical protein
VTGVCNGSQRRKWGRRLTLLLSLSLVLLLAAPQELWARRGGRIVVPRTGSFSRPPQVSRPMSRAESWGSRSTVVTPRMGSRSSSRPSSTTTPSTQNRNGVDQAALDRARTQGTVFSSRADAERAFERDYAQRFPTKYSREPEVRPSHIPQTTAVDGQSYQVNYDPRRGEYGYMRNGTWVAYNTFRDATILSMLMGQHGYVYGAPGRDRSGDGKGENGEGSGRDRPIIGAGSGLLLLLLLIGAWAMIPRRRGGYRLDATPEANNQSVNHPMEKRLNNDWTPYSLRFWRNLKPGSTIILTDEQTLQDMIETGESISTGRDYHVEEVWRIRESRDVAEWQFFRIRSPHDEDATWLLIKSAGEQLSAGMYFEADGFQSGTRRELLDRNFYWVFNEPRDRSSFQLLDLNYASHLYFNLELDGEIREVEFAKLGNLEFHGHVSIDPPQRDMEKMIGTVAEYETMLPVPNPRVLFFEAGLPSQDGGFIRMLQGAGIRLSDLEVLPAGSNS